MKSMEVGLRYEKLEMEVIHWHVNADSSFSTNNDLSKHLGYFEILCDSHDRCHILDYTSRNIKRLVRSIMSGEVQAFMDSFDMSYSINRDL